jgi:hypothetical protein
VLTGWWVEYALLPNAQPRRRWRFTVMCRDALIERSGNIATRTGRQLAADLWTAWALNATLVLRDIDYDSTLAQYAVRIIHLEEQVERPADTADFGHSLVTLTLVQL